MANLKDIRGRISSVKNIRKITRAMEMVAAARLRRAEQRIAHLRPYAGAIRRMTRQAAEAAGGDWSDETEQAVRDAVAEFADDFGYDLDEEGQPLDEDSPDRDTRDRSDSRSASEEETQEQESEEREGAAA